MYNLKATEGESVQPTRGREFRVASMHPGITAKRRQLIELCEKHHVERLELFGSAAVGGFDERSSDVDFLVVFEPCEPVDHYERYFGLLEDLEEVLGRSVDLVEAGAIRNPYFLESVNETRTPIYAA